MAFGLGEGQLQRRLGSDQSVWRGGDRNGFVRIALAGLLDVRKCRSVGGGVGEGAIPPRSFLV